MMGVVRASALVLVIATAVGADQDRAPRESGRAAEPWRGACYCRLAGTLDCVPDVTERECRRRCDEALADDWMWRERLPCWNWGYGG